jgi:DNA-binding CsgD family transcriptional regulator
MEKRLDKTDGWVSLALPDAAAVPRDRIALALRYAMHLAGRARRGAELGSATLSSVAHLVGADAGLLARADTASLAAALLAALARGAQSSGRPDGAEPSPSTTPADEAWRRPRRSMRKILADPRPSAEVARETPSSSSDRESADPADSGDPLLLFGWRVVAIRPDSAMTEADHLDLRPTLAPALAQLGRRLLEEAMQDEVKSGSAPSSPDAGPIEGDRLLRIGDDVVVSIVQHNAADAIREPGRDPLATLSAPASSHERPIDDDELESEVLGDDVDKNQPDPDATLGSVTTASVPSAAAEMNTGGHVSQLAIDSAALRAAIIAGTTSSAAGASNVASAAAMPSKQIASPAGHSALASARPVVWSLLALHGVAADPSTLAVLQAFHRAAVDAGLLVDDRPDLLATLSRGERETVQLLLTGKSETAIASLLRRSPHTIHSHVKRVYRKLGVASRAELMAKLLPG